MQSGGDGVMLEVGEFDPPWLRGEAKGGEKHSEKAMCVITLDTQKGHRGGRTLEGCSYDSIPGMAGTHRSDRKGSESSVKSQCTQPAAALTSDSS